MTPVRRLAIACVAAAFLAACSGGGDRKETTPPTEPSRVDSLADLRVGRQLSLLVAMGQDPRDAAQTGKSFVAFNLTTDQGFVTDGTPTLYLARNDRAKPLGPFEARWSDFSGYEATGDTSPRTQIPGIFWAEIDIPDPGLYTLVAIGDVGGRAYGEAHAYFSTKVQHAVGSKAVSTDTPVATKPADIKKICTRVPPDELHSISLADALQNGKPTVVSFGTPALCESQLCGPVLDEAILAAQHIGSAANFIHVEEFLPGDDLLPPEATLENQSPAFKAWRLTTEPWTYVIDAGGVIRARFEGPVVADEIEAALGPLLS